MSVSILKKKLKTLNYPTDFSDDSYELIERLLGDLMQTSKLYQQLKCESSKQPLVQRPDDRTLQNHIQLLQTDG